MDEKKVQLLMNGLTVVLALVLVGAFATVIRAAVQAASH
jgi:hypothetical protein